jgi:hypothetical protein
MVKINLPDSSFRLRIGEYLRGRTIWIAWSEAAKGDLASHPSAQVASGIFQIAAQFGNEPVASRGFLHQNTAAVLVIGLAPNEIKRHQTIKGSSNGRLGYSKLRREPTDGLRLILDIAGQ